MVKIEGRIQISGYTRVVFYKKNCFDKCVTFSGGIFWKDSIRNKTIDHTTMVEIIKAATRNPTRDVWVEGETVNINRVGKKELKRVTNYLKLDRACAVLHLPQS